MSECVSPLRSGGKRRSEENGETLSSSKQSRKRRRRSSRPLTPSHSPTLHSSPPHSAEGSVGCHENGITCQGNGVSNHENGVDVKSGDDSDVMPHGSGTKKRRLHHSNYHIEMEGAELQGSEVNSEPKVVTTVVKLLKYNFMYIHVVIVFHILLSALACWHQWSIGSLL